MRVLKAFKTTTQSFKAGDEFYDDIENLEHWTARGFVEAEEFVDGVVQPSTAAPAAPVATPAAPTPVPTATFA